MVRMDNMEFRRIPLITSTNNYIKGQTYRIDGESHRYFVFDKITTKGSFWDEVAVELNIW